MERSSPPSSPTPNNNPSKNLKYPSPESCLIRHPSITNLLEEQSEQSSPSPIESKYTNIPCLKVNNTKVQSKGSTTNASKKQTNYFIFIDTCGEKLHNEKDNFFIESPNNKQSPPSPSILSLSQKTNSPNINSSHRLLLSPQVPSPNRMSYSEQKLDFEITKSIQEGASYSRIEKKFSKYLSVSKNK